MRFQNFLIILSIPFFIGFLHSCDLINPSEEIPAYIHIDTFTLSGSYDSFGTVNHRITDAWVVLDNEVVGVFELPTTFPVLSKGEHKLIIQAGVIENGISNTRTSYPFYEPLIIDNYNFQELHIDTINPKVRYKKSNMYLALNEDFESANLDFDPSATSNVSLARTSEDQHVFEGNYSFEAVLEKNGDKLEMISENIFVVPRGKAVFLEMNYKSDIEFTVGYFALSSTSSKQHPVLYLNPSKEWKKVYVNYGTEIAFEDLHDVFKLFVGSYNASTDTAKIYLDNLKLLWLE
ncbi:MAG: hypothetical protein HN431_08230 [Bacteroidetes bacterium]|nr:hypothetical protein [Bacteroidota bacterium]